MKIVFLDRDGVINRYPGDAEYVKSWKEFHFLPKVKIALKKLINHEYKIFIISNQAGVSKGIYSQETLNFITENMLKDLSAYGIDIAGVYYCTHLPEAHCSCRKPKTGLIERALTSLIKKKRQLTDSFLIGDTIRDIETGKKVGLKTILVFSGKEKPENKNNWQILPDFTAQNLSEAVNIILRGL